VVEVKEVIVAMIGIGSKGRIADINVTPMADVMIVLLIIFMVTTPILGEGPVRNLPEADHTRGHDDAPLVVAIASDSSVFVGDARVSNALELSTTLLRELGSARRRSVQVKADAGLPYAEVARVLDACRAAGADEIAFVTRPRKGL
jgi:biopolymer transport protein TolR